MHPPIRRREQGTSPRVSRRLRAGFGAVSLGVVVHVVCGGARLSCVSVPVAATAGMIATLAAGRLLGRSLMSVAAVAVTLGAGQYLMHLSLSWRVLSLDVTAAEVDAGGLLLAHGGATLLLTLSMVGARNALSLLCDAVARLRAALGPPRGRPWPMERVAPFRRFTTGIAPTATHDVTAHPLRGPPVAGWHRPAPS